MYQWTVIRALGEDNLIKAIDDYERDGWEIFQMMFAGVEVVQHKISGKQMPVSRFIIVARKQTLEVT